ncbi:MAG: Protein of unknown function (DUF3467) [Methanobacterium sp. Maddingley MBC34]|nr:MAG: Protein of unknown function (DUF3467) [Methanobacterium sp. Maddingley MBC34]
MAAEKDEVPIIINSEIKQIYVTGAFGGFTAHDMRIAFFNEAILPIDKPDEDFRVAKVADYEVIMSHTSAKELYMWLGKRIKEFEDITGPIERPTFKDPEKKAEAIKSIEKMKKSKKK